MANIKNVILKKKIDDVIYELLVKTSVAQVSYDDTTSLAAKLTVMLADIKDSKDKLGTLLGDDEASSITGQIESAVQAAVDAINNEEDATSLAGKLKALTEVVAGMNDASTGILATAKAYTDEKIGLSGTAYSTVKEYVDAVKSELGQSIAGAFHFKGTVDYVADLPSEDMAIGDVYQVKFRGTSGSVALDAEYAYDGTNWVELGGIVDLSAYYTAEQTTTAITTAKTEAIDAAAADATSKADAAQAAAIAAAAADATSKADAAETNAKAYTDGEVTKVNATVATKARFIVSEVEPEDLTEADVWAQVITE